MSKKDNTLICEEVLDEAKDLVGGDRHRDYGDKLINHERIAKLWSTYLEKDIRPDQVAIMMGLVKVARSMHNPQKKDTYVDLSAYSAIAYEIVKRTEDNFLTEAQKKSKRSRQAIEEWREEYHRKLRQE